jgi:hypothetical protein
LSFARPFERRWLWLTGLMAEGSAGAAELSGVIPPSTGLRPSYYRWYETTLGRLVNRLK